MAACLEDRMKENTETKVADWEKKMASLCGGLCIESGDDGVYSMHITSVT